MPTIDLPHGTINYRVAGPDHSVHPPVVFVHGLLVNGELWSGVAAELADHGIRSYAPDWPLGSHKTALHDGVDQTPRGVAATILSFLEALDLDDVTLVGNDTGGALCQFVIDTDASRIGRLVLTNCDAFDEFPPAPFDKLMKPAATVAGLLAMMTPMRSTRLRHSAVAYGLLSANPLDAALTRRWVEPCIADAGVRRDTSAFVRSIDKQDLLGVSTRLPRFTKPVLLVWGAADRFFKVDFAHRLAELFPDVRLVEVEGGRTYIPLDDPRRVAGEIVAALYPAAESGDRVTAN